MWFWGFSLDNLSLLATDARHGFVVDDAIVVLENIVRKVEGGLEPLEGAIQGANEIFFTVIRFSDPLVAVFIPLLSWAASSAVSSRIRRDADDRDYGLGGHFVTLTPLMARSVLTRGEHKEMGAVARRSTRRSNACATHTSGRSTVPLARRGLVLILTGVSVGATILGFVLIPKGFFPLEIRSHVGDHASGAGHFVFRHA